MGNIVKVNCGKANEVTAAPLHQYDYGQILIIDGIELPAAYQVHFSNEPYGSSTTSIGTEDGVLIPDAYLQSGADVYAWLYLHEGEDDGETVKSIRIPVIARAEITNETPSTVEQSEIDELIIALNTAVDAAEDAEAAAEAAAEAIQDMDVEASTLAAGSSATVTKTVDPETGAVTLSFGIPKGDTGAQGPAGADGQPGADGQDGQDGRDGTDATPDLITVIYDDLTFPVSAGTLCYHGEALYKANQDISTSESWTAAHWTETTVETELNSLKSAITELDTDKYEKPSGGIPSSDMASAVQTSLGKADSAYQKPQNGIPASDMASGVIPDITGKQDKPDTAGTAGQVLTLDSNLDPVWTDKDVDPDVVAGAVSDWLDDHPDATTTVQDGAITRSKLNDDLKKKTDSAQKTIGYLGIIGKTKENFSTAEIAKPNKITFVGNQYAFSNCRYADRKNHMPRVNGSGTSDGLPWTKNDFGFMVLNGTSNSSGDISYLWEDVSIPAGSYRLFIDINAGQSTITNSATYKIRWWYTNEDTEHNDTVSLSDTSGYVDVVFESSVRSINVRTGKNKNNTYSNFIVWYGLYERDVTVVDTGNSVSNNSTYSYTVSTPPLFSVIDTMQHKGTVEYLSTGKDSKPIITPEQFGALGDALTDDTVALQNCINYAIQNKAIVYGKAIYRITAPIVIHGNYLKIYLYGITSWDVTGYLVEVAGMSNNIEISRLTTSSGSGLRVCSYNGIDCMYNYFNMRMINVSASNKICIKIEGDTSAGTPPYVSYNAFVLGNVVSSHSHCIVHGEYTGENEFYNAKIRCPEGWGFYHPVAVRCFGLSFESDVFGAIYADNESGGTFLGCRHTELTDKIPRKQYGFSVTGGTLIKFVGFRHDLLYETSEIVPYQAIDTSEIEDLTAPSMDTYKIDEEWRKAWNRFYASIYKRIVRCPICYGHNNNKNGGVLLGDEMAVLAGKKVCKPAIRSVYKITDADFDMRDTAATVYTNNNPYATLFEIGVADCVIHLASSYCCEGYNEFIVDQSDSTKLCTIYNSYDAVNPIFDGVTRGAGVYKLTCYCDYESTTDKLPSDWESDGYTTTFYTGYNDKWVIEKLS